MAFCAPMTDSNQRQLCVPLQTQQLPLIKNDELIAFNALYRCPPVAGNKLVWHWRLNRDCRPQYRVQFTASAGRLRLDLNGDIVGTDREPIDWIQYGGHTRLIAWAHTHEDFVQLVQAVWGCDWVPESIEQAAPPLFENDTNEITVGFSVRHKTGELAVAGSATFPLAWAEKISARQVDNPVATSGIEPAWHTAVARLPWVIDEFDVSRQQWQSIVRGSVIRLDNSSLKSQSARITVLSGRDTLIGELAGMRIRIVAAYRDFNIAQIFSNDPGESVGMNSEHEDTAVSNTAEKSTVDNRAVDLSGDELPVTLNFEAGQLTLKFSELRCIQPGYVFELDKKLEDRLITVYANGSRIGRGQLVVVDDFVGVRITEIATQ